MHYLTILILLTILIIIYFKIADKYNIVDHPNERSSHTQVTLRGGGIIFWFVALCYFILHIDTSYLFFTGITLVSFISFYDDIKSLPNKLRAFIQLLAISILFYDLNVLSTLPWWGIIIIYILSVGIINAFNFMDGINGMTGLHTLIILSSLAYVNHYVHPFIDEDLIIYPIIASLVFLFFNFRKKAKCFAGDVGSISIAYWVIYLILKLILATNSIIWVLFLAVYGVETVCTILHRLYLKQNIFKPHRLHLYQILSNEYKFDHRLVSFLYAFIQGFISIVIIISYKSSHSYIIFTSTIVFLVLLYSIKFNLIRKNATKINKG